MHTSHATLPPLPNSTSTPTFHPHTLPHPPPPPSNPTLHHPPPPSTTTILHMHIQLCSMPNSSLSLHWGTLPIAGTPTTFCTVWKRWISDSGTIRLSGLDMRHLRMGSCNNSTSMSVQTVRWCSRLLYSPSVIILPCSVTVLGPGTGSWWVRVWMMRTLNANMSTFSVFPFSQWLAVVVGPQECGRVRGIMCTLERIMNTKRKG